MPLSQLTLSDTLGYSLSSPNPAGATTYGPGSDASGLNNILVATWDTLFAGLFWIPANFTFTATTTNSSPTLSSLSALTNIQVGQLLTGTGIPAGTYVSVVGGSTITMSKNATASNSGVTITAQTAPTGPSATLASGGSLTNSQAYYYKVTATGPAGAIGPTVASSTNESMPSLEVTATASNPNLSIIVAWTAVQGATGYKVYRGTSAGSENLLVATVSGGSTVSWTDTGVAGSGASPPSSPPNPYVEFDVSSFTMLDGSAGAPLHALTLKVNCTVGANASSKFAPGTSNGLVWFFSGTTPALVWSGKAFFTFSLDISQTGQTIDGSHKTFRLTNTGGQPTYTSVELVGSST